MSNTDRAVFYSSGRQDAPPTTPDRNCSEITLTKSSTRATSYSFGLHSRIRDAKLDSVANGKPRCGFARGVHAPCCATQALLFGAGA